MGPRERGPALPARLLRKRSGDPLAYANSHAAGVLFPPDSGKHARLRSGIFVGTALILGLAAVWLNAIRSGPVIGPDHPAQPVAVTRESADTISFPARVEASHFHRRLLGMPGYHFLVSAAGGASAAALLVTEVTDVQVLDALEALGAKPGNGLAMDSWDERKNPESGAPDRQIAGPPMAVLVRVPGHPAPLRLDQLLEDPAGRGFEMRLGGHRANIPHWHSGCVICLYSCPGSKIGNARYSVRDYTRATTIFRARPGVLPADGSTVEILLRLLPAPGTTALAEPVPGT